VERCKELKEDEIPRLRVQRGLHLRDDEGAAALGAARERMEARGKLEGAFPMAVKMVEIFALAVRARYSRASAWSSFSWISSGAWLQQGRQRSSRRVHFVYPGVLVPLPETLQAFRK